MEGDSTLYVYKSIKVVWEQELYTIICNRNFRKIHTSFRLGLWMLNSLRHKSEKGECRTCCEEHAPVHVLLKYSESMSRNNISINNKWGHVCKAILRVNVENRPNKNKESVTKVGPEVLTPGIWDITPCSPLKVNRRFGGTCRPYFRVEE
jgi:hypothetical protein